MTNKTKITMKRIGYCILGSLLLTVKAFAVKPDTVNIENQSVYSYTNGNVYQSARDKTVIKKYLDGLDENRLDQPNLVRIKLPSAAASDGKFYVSKSADYSNATITNIKKGDTECIIMNPIPQTLLYSKAVIGGKTVVEKQTFIDGRVRMIYVPSVKNVRDMGGWLTDTGQRVQYGLFYRGGELDFQEQHIATQEDIDELLRLGIGADVDLREESESHQTHSALGNNVPYIFKNHASSDYTAIKNDALKWKEEFQFIVNNLREGKSIYSHCIMGADRTGLQCFLLGGLLGMNIDQLIKDYELTSMAGKDYYRDCSKLILYMEYMNTRNGKNLTERFYNYFRNDLNITDKYIRDFRKIMLEGYESYLKTTDIEDIYEEEATNDDTIYDLSGRAIEKPAKGFYIQNGKKYLAR